MSNAKGGPRTAEDKARQRRRDAVREPLSIGLATMAYHRPELFEGERKVLSVLPAGVVDGAKMRRLAFQSPGAFFGGDVPARLVPMEDWAEEEWTRFFAAARWEAGDAAAMARGAWAGEFGARGAEKVATLTPGEKYDSRVGKSLWDGITRRVLEAFELGFTGTIDDLTAEMGLDRERLVRAVGRLKTRGLVVSDHCRPASYCSTVDKKGEAA